MWIVYQHTQISFIIINCVQVFSLVYSYFSILSFFFGLTDLLDENIPLIKREKKKSHPVNEILNIKRHDKQKEQTHAYLNLDFFFLVSIMWFPRSFFFRCLSLWRNNKNLFDAKGVWFAFVPMGDKEGKIGAQTYTSKIHWAQEKKTYFALTNSDEQWNVLLMNFSTVLSMYIHFDNIAHFQPRIFFFRDALYRNSLTAANLFTRKTISIQRRYNR